MAELGLPKKPYYRIGEVARALGVEPHVLRYWQSEFPQIKPRRAPSRHRIYLSEDIRTLALIKRLLHDEGYTLAGAKKRLAQGPGRDEPQPGPTPPKHEPQPKPEPAMAATQPALPGMDPGDQDRKEVLGELKDILKLLG